MTDLQSTDSCASVFQRAKALCKYTSAVGNGSEFCCAVCSEVKERMKKAKADKASKKTTDAKTKAKPAKSVPNKPLQAKSR